jgi:hypothetical protein
LESIAKLPAKGGEEGKLIEPLPDRLPEVENPSFEPQLAVDPFRRDLPQAVSTRDIWPWLVLAGSCLFLADVFVRRVQISLEWLWPLWDKFATVVLRRQPHAAPVETMSRLRSRKADVERAIESRRAATRFEPDPAAPVDPNAVAATQAKPTTPGSTPTPTQKPVAEEESPDSYTSRLLKAKKQVWKQRDGEQEK